MDWLMSNAVKLGGGGGVFLIQKSAFQTTVLAGLSLVDDGRQLELFIMVKTFG